MMTVSVLEGATFLYEVPRSLFSFTGFRNNRTHHFYDVSGDDNRFVMMRGAEDTGQVIVVDNFFEELKRLVPNN